MTISIRCRDSLQIDSIKHASSKTQSFTDLTKFMKEKRPMLAMLEKSAFHNRAGAPNDRHEWDVLVLPCAERAANRLHARKCSKTRKIDVRRHLQSFTVFHVICPKPCNTGVSQSHLLYPITIRYFFYISSALSSLLYPPEVTDRRELRSPPSLELFPVVAGPELVPVAVHATFVAGVVLAVVAVVVAAA